MIYIYVFQLPKLSERVGLCHRCQGLLPYSNISTWKLHVSKANCETPKAQPFQSKCETCGTEFTRASRAEDHNCPLQGSEKEREAATVFTIASPKQQSEFKLMNHDSEVFLQGLSGRIIVPDIFPVISVPDKWKRYTLLFKRYGNVRGGEFYKEMLKEKVKDGGDNAIVIPKSISIVSETCEEIAFLSPQILVPRSKELLCQDLADNEVIISLKNPPTRMLFSQESELYDCSVYQRYIKKNGMEHNPHL